VKCQIGWSIPVKNRFWATAFISKRIDHFSIRSQHPVISTLGIAIFHIMAPLSSVTGYWKEVKSERFILGISQMQLSRMQYWEPSIVVVGSLLRLTREVRPP